MTEFAPLPLCKKLVELGCKSESPFVYAESKASPGMWVGPCFIEKIGYQFPRNTKLCPAFTQNDFTGATVQAGKNCSKVWREEIEIIGGVEIPNTIQEKRIAMINLKRELWHQFLERTMKQ